MRRALALLFLVGCGQSYRDGMSVLCNLDEQAACKQPRPEERAVCLERYADAHIHNPRARKVYRAIASTSPRDVPALLTNAMHEAGGGACPDADAQGRAIVASWRQSVDEKARACDGGDGRACAAAAMLLGGPPDGVPPDAARATALEKKACELGIKESCQ